MEEVASPVNPKLPVKRTVWFSILLILSYAGGVTGLLIAVVSAVGGQVETFFKTLPVFDTILLEDSTGNWFYLLLKILLFAGSLTAVTFMWKLKRIGYWLYISVQIILLVIPFLFLNKLGFAYISVRFIMNTIFTLLFIMLYSVQLKRLS
jgi:hypothetical protein